MCYTSSLYLISEGKGVIRTDGRSYETSAGALVYIPAGQPHDWIADPLDPMVHICCYFDWHYVDRKQEFEWPSYICYDPELLRPSLVGPKFPFAIPEYTKVENLQVWIDWFRSFYTSNKYSSEATYMRSLNVQSHFQRFIEYFLAYVLDHDKIPDPRMDKILEQLERDLLSGPPKPLKTYYENLHISAGYFFELFKKGTGFTPIQYVHRFRINRSKDDLLHSELSVTEIAQKYHFASVHYFSKLFRKVTGLSPREYRDQMGAHDR
ncbi:AraC family transcriptional regulator [Paenibacillus mendelii]|uniref:Helix-turn-helix domain-containing protein n=1 Tax=Paenibacillus mendelii TaxID=206163 RepID=A0ABV6J2L8_9BACL|nr:AraC family transcriptional regulator [Paenibacillus mendelii]MCQ6559233.1 AraC family transcriptional regulator [Paenibacillus mendelii]